MSTGTCIKCGKPPGRRVARGMCGRCYQAWYTRQRAYGRFESLYIPIDSLVDHIGRLNRAGLGYARISELSGVPRRTVQALAHRRRSTCHRDTADRILSVAVPVIALDEALAGGVRIPSVGTVRRLRALTAAGHTTSDLAERLGMHFQVVSLIQRGEHQNVTARVARAVARLFDQLEMIPGLSQPAKRRAARLGWALPLEWDEGTIDDPSARPFRRAMSSDDFLSEYEKLRARGYTQTKIAELMGIHQGSLSKRLRRCA